MEKSINVCYCMGVDSRKIKEKVDEGCETFLEVKKATGLGCGCGRCEDHGIKVFKEIIKEKH